MSAAAAERFVTEPATRENLEPGAIIEFPTWSGPATGVIVYAATPSSYNFTLHVRASDGHVDVYEWIPTAATVTRLNPNR